MYFPYIRGRQYDLLALRELTNNDLLGKSVIPIIEPVKLNINFDSTVNAFIHAKKPLAVVINPEVGEFAGKNELVNVYLERYKTVGSIIPALVMNKRAKRITLLLRERAVRKDKLLVVLEDNTFIKEYKTMFDSDLPRYTLFPDARAFRRAVAGNRVMFMDNFNKKTKNTEYPEDEFFTEDHLHYINEGYIGFGDYTVIGEEYFKRGPAPYAVAIHIVYFDKDNKLRIKHFLSDSNEDTSDTAGKFFEAVAKLKKWVNSRKERQLTFALSTLINFATKNYFPGLPTIKKLSVMHHIELVGKYFDGGIVQ
jgi:hypothetical protein